MRRYAVLALLLTGCADAPSAPPAPGTLALSIRADGPAAGAVLLTVSGGPVTRVTAAAGVTVAERRDAAGVHLLLVGDVSGAMATLEIPDAGRAGDYAVAIAQVAARTGSGLLDPSPYLPALTPAPRAP